ncbi:GIY-YIG nuclease family protein [Sphingobacterium hungaricum]|uniref:Endonuclease n=1 Tax=Sphingobacterium hungaricum TaxID=2082723 RepID=A0A928UUZ0_9SPHI|nr:hypothetical protein [Sphingobacterium hungaricum]MBE8712338.1 hypothetical protein [Sphingobacterium hungaricum]
MNNVVVYIVTDSNRKFLEIGTSTNLSQTIFELQNHNKTLFSAFGNLNRVVFSEEFSNPFLAEKKVSELRNYTRMQIERLIRKTNPNWLNLCVTAMPLRTKKVAAYASNT